MIVLIWCFTCLAIIAWTFSWELRGERLVECPKCNGHGIIDAHSWEPCKNCKGSGHEHWKRDERCC